MVTFNPIEREQWTLSKEAEDIVANGSHEIRLLEEVIKAIDGLSLVDIDVCILYMFNIETLNLLITFLRKNSQSSERKVQLLKLVNLKLSRRAGLDKLVKINLLQKLIPSQKIFQESNYRKLKKPVHWPQTLRN